MNKFLFSKINKAGINVFITHGSNSWQSKSLVTSRHVVTQLVTSSSVASLPF